MRLKQIKIWLFVLIVLSCSRDTTKNSIPGGAIIEPDIVVTENDQSQWWQETVEIADNAETTETKESEEPTVIQNTEPPEFNPTHILLASGIFEAPNIESRQLWHSSMGTLIEILEHEENEQWVKFRRDNDRTAWTLANQVKEFTGYYPMNKISIEYLILETIPDNSKFRIEGKYGHFSFEYGMNKIHLSFYSRNENFDKDFQFNNAYWPDRFRTMEYFVNNNIEVFPSPNWTTNGRKNEINSITIADTFMFAAHESQNQSIRRVVYITTSNYDIEITIMIPGSSFDNDLIRQIMREAPQYFFLISLDASYSGEDPRENSVAWDYRNDAITRFGNDLRNGTNPSHLLNQWYNETERILQGLILK